MVIMLPVLVQFAILSPVLCGWSTRKFLSVTNNFRDKIALEVLKVSPVNTVVSPIGLKMPLCKLVAVAEGDGKNELMSALGIPSETMISNCYNDFRKLLTITQFKELMIHSKIYLNDSIDINPDFVKNSFGEYGVKVDKVGFRLRIAASKYINRWVASETLSRIPTLIDEDDINNSTSMVLLSGLYYKGNWESPFDVRFTEFKIFRDEMNKATKIPMMTKLGNFDYIDDVNYHVKVLNLKFESMGTSITFLMPEKKNGLPELLEKLSSDSSMMTKLRKSLTNQYIKIYIPRIKIKTYVDWTDFLRLIGINKILSPESRSFAGIVKNGTVSQVPVHLSKAKQKVFLDIDEMGLTRYMKRIDADRERETREMVMLGDRAEQLEFDQPFYFVISLASGGVHHDLFNGVYRGPE